MAEFLSFNSRSVWQSLLVMLLGGMTSGGILNFAEASGVSGASDFGNYFGLWIFLVTMIAAWSPTWQRAIVHTVAFLIAMVTTYYLSTLLLAGYFLAHLLWAWLAVALVFGSPFAALAWHARQQGRYAALTAAMPIGLLLYEAYSLRLVSHLHGVQFIFDIMAAVVLFLILPRNQNQRLRVFAFIPIYALGAKIISEYVLPIAAGFRL